MAKLNVIIPDSLYKEFKKAIIERFGGKKGDMTKAIIEAIQDWINKNK